MVPIGGGLNEGNESGCGRVNEEREEGGKDVGMARRRGPGD